MRATEIELVSVRNHHHTVGGQRHEEDFCIAPDALRADRGERGMPNRRSVALHAEALLRHNLRTRIRLDDVYKAIGTSERYLHLAFREEFGIPPKTYLRMLRLNGVRHDLRHAQPGETV